MFNVQTRGAGMRRVYVFALLALQIATYFLVLCKSTDLTYELYYALIVSCFITSLVLVNRSNQSIFQFCALLFTCIADYCLILEQGTKIAGVSFFHHSATFLLSAHVGDGKRGEGTAVEFRDTRGGDGIFALFCRFGVRGEGGDVISSFRDVLREFARQYCVCVRTFQREQAFADRFGAVCAV